MMSDALVKAVELAFANPSESTRMLLAAAFLLIAAAPIAALVVVGFALRALGARGKQREE
jgi:hypothetical protein